MKKFGFTSIDRKRPRRAENTTGPLPLLRYYPQIEGTQGYRSFHKKFDTSLRNDAPVSHRSLSLASMSV